MDPTGVQAASLNEMLSGFLVITPILGFSGTQTYAALAPNLWPVVVPQIASPVEN